MQGLFFLESVSTLPNEGDAAGYAHNLEDRAVEVALEAWDDLAETAGAVPRRSPGAKFARLSSPSSTLKASVDSGR